MSAIATQLTVFPNIKTIPAIFPAIDPSTLFAYRYVPPVWGYKNASCADEEAFANARVLASSKPKIEE